MDKKLDQQFQLISRQEANEQFKIDSYWFDGDPFDPMLIFLHKGDILIEGDLNFDWFLHRSYTLFEEYPGALSFLLIIDGNLTLDGVIESPYHPCLFVTGTIKTKDAFENLWELTKNKKIEAPSLKIDLDIEQMVCKIDINTFTRINFKKMVNKIPLVHQVVFIEATMKRGLIARECVDGMTICQYMLLHWVEQEYKGTKKEKLILGKKVAQFYGLSVRDFRINGTPPPSLLPTIQKYF